MGGSRRAEPVWAGSLGVLLSARAEEGVQKTGLEEGLLSGGPSGADGCTNDGLSLFCVF